MLAMCLQDARPQGAEVESTVPVYKVTAMPCQTLDRCGSITYFYNHQRNKCINDYKVA